MTCPAGLAVFSSCVAQRWHAGRVPNMITDSTVLVRIRDTDAMSSCTDIGAGGAIVAPPNEFCSAVDKLVTVVPGRWRCVGGGGGGGDGPVIGHCITCTEHRALCRPPTRCTFTDTMPQAAPPEHPSGTDTDNARTCRVSGDRHRSGLTHYIRH